jgi:hypothetical protein
MEHVLARFRLRRLDSVRDGRVAHRAGGRTGFASWLRGSEPRAFPTVARRPQHPRGCSGRHEWTRTRRRQDVLHWRIEREIIGGVDHPPLARSMPSSRRIRPSPLRSCRATARWTRGVAPHWAEPNSVRAERPVQLASVVRVDRVDHPTPARNAFGLPDHRLEALHRAVGRCSRPNRRPRDRSWDPEQLATAEAPHDGWELLPAGRPAGSTGG